MHVRYGHIFFSWPCRQLFIQRAYGFYNRSFLRLCKLRRGTFNLHWFDDAKTQWFAGWSSQIHLRKWRAKIHVCLLPVTQQDFNSSLLNVSLIHVSYFTLEDCLESPDLKQDYLLMLHKWSEDWSPHDVSQTPRLPRVQFNLTIFQLWENKLFHNNYFVGKNVVKSIQSEFYNSASSQKLLILRHCLEFAYCSAVLDLSFA